MEDVAKICFKYSGETDNYYIFILKPDELSPRFFPKKIYLRKDLFQEEPEIVNMTIN